VPESGEGVWLRDVDGNTYLDMMAGIAVITTGHAQRPSSRLPSSKKLMHTCSTLSRTSASRAWPSAW
jgi:4-aminobutyrate aminotransferase